MQDWTVVQIPTTWTLCIAVLKFRQCDMTGQETWIILYVSFGRFNEKMRYTLTFAIYLKTDLLGLYLTCFLQWRNGLQLRLVESFSQINMKLIKKKWQKRMQIWKQTAFQTKKVIKCCYLFYKVMFQCFNHQFSVKNKFKTYI